MKTNDFNGEMFAIYFILVGFANVARQGRAPSMEAVNTIFLKSFGTTRQGY